MWQSVPAAVLAGQTRTWPKQWNGKAEPAFATEKGMNIRPPVPYATVLIQAVPARSALSPTTIRLNCQGQRVGGGRGQGIGPARSRMCRIGLTNCPYCGSYNVYASTPRNLWEMVSVVFLLRRVRCHVCMHRHYRPILLFTAKRPRSKGS